MRQIAFAVLLTTFALNSALAQGTCQSRAIDKNGKPLAGAAFAQLPDEVCEGHV
jgi:hypothetical protein